MGSGVPKEKDEGYRSFKNSDEKMHPEWGGWDAPQRPGGLQIHWEKSPTGKTEDYACSGIGTERQTDNPPQHPGGRELGSPKWVETPSNRPVPRS